MRIAPQSFVRSNQLAHVLGHRRQRRRLPFHHVAIEVGRPAHGLARVVDDEVEARAGGEQLAAERLDARRVAQIEAEDLEAMSPLAEVGLAGVPLRRVARKPRRDDDVRAGAQQLERGLIADLDAAAGDQRDTSAQIGQLGALAEVERRAVGTELIVEVVNDGEVLLADVAMLTSSVAQSSRVARSSESLSS